MEDSIQELQARIDAATGSVTIAPGSYWIDASKGLRLRSNLTLNLDGVTLRAVPNSLQHSRILALRDVENVVINGGLLIGERHAHVGTEGEWGFGVELRNAKTISLTGMTMTDCWGDGIYVGSCETLTIRKTRCLRNRRNGMSIVSGKDILVEDSEFSYAKGTRPEDGIDVEPNKGANDVVDGLIVRRCKFVANGRYGFQVLSKHGVVSNFRVEQCSFKGQIPTRIDGKKGPLLEQVAGLLGVYAISLAKAAIA